MLKDLEFAQIITRGYSAQCLLRVIESTIEQSATPINIHNLKLDAFGANQAFLDLIESTRKQYPHRTILDNFAPHDHRNGNVCRWFRDGFRVMRAGYGFTNIRVWNGRDTIDARTENLVIGDYVISAVTPVSVPITERPYHKTRGILRSSGKVHIVGKPVPLPV